MTEAAQIYVGSDERMHKAERALENSLRGNSSIEIDIHWMRSGDPGFDDWNIGRLRGRPYSGGAWSTDFTCFRFAVPELAGFEGRAIYLDVDMVVLGDIGELWTRESTKPWTCPDGRSEVSMIECAAFRDPAWWPRLAEMKPSGNSVGAYWQALASHGFVDTILPAEWNCLDHWTPTAKLIHFTNMHTQPWKPWPDVLSYQAHADPRAVLLFWEYHDGAPAGQLAPRS